MTAKTAPHVLVVDDEPDLREVIAEGLRAVGFRVSCANDASDARQAIDQGDLIDVAIIDVVMPGELGGSLAEHVHSLGVPIVLISGNPDAMDQEVLERIHCVRVAKPFQTEEITRAVRDAMASAGVLSDRAEPARMTGDAS